MKGPGAVQQIIFEDHQHKGAGACRHDRPGQHVDHAPEQAEIDQAAGQAHDCEPDERDVHR